MSFAVHGGLLGRYPTTPEVPVSETETTTRITHIGTVRIPVADHDKALDFYVGTLGSEHASTRQPITPATCRPRGRRKNDQIAKPPPAHEVAGVAGVPRGG